MVARIARVRAGGSPVLAALLAIAACAERAPSKPSEARRVAAEPEAAVGESPPPASEAPKLPVMAVPVPLWKGGKAAHEVDASLASLHGHLVVDLGEAWTPYLFTDGVRPDGKEAPNSYRATYLALARGEFPDDYHGERAQSDKYLELYGILPTLTLLRERFRHTAGLACARELDLQPVVAFQGLVTYTSNPAARKFADDFAYNRAQVQRLLHEHKADAPEALDPAKLDARDKDRRKRYLKALPIREVLAATQERLKCEGYTRGRGRVIPGALDWVTHESLAEFERRHRIYSWGYLGKDTLEYLRMTPVEAERQAVLRVLTERAIHASGVIEDGSTGTLPDGTPRTFKGEDGMQHPLPNLVEDLQKRIIAAFGLQTPESTLAWLEGLGELAATEHRYVAIEAPELPEYYDGDMVLTLEYDRGDVWYDFPFDDTGKGMPQPVERRPRVTLFAHYLGQRIPIARFGTTIGGWRSESVEGVVMWKYKESPVGPRVWKQISAAPVWLPPDGTPVKDLLKRRKKRKPGEPEFEINRHEVGPSYASAYGLVAAYHKKYLERADGSIAIGNDEGIRTHGSVDYMSIMRRHSHGCHRLHNHIAVRLMSFVLAHRTHQRLGQQPLSFKKEYEHEEEKYELDLKQGGYLFELEKPLRVEVMEGRIRGDVKAPMDFVIPKFDPDAGAYLMPDGGGAVQVRGNQLVGVPVPERAGEGALADPPLDAYGDPVPPGSPPAP
jgi:hypothetical protein